MRNLQTTCFWIGAVWLGYVYFGYPLVLAFIAYSRRIRPDARDDYWPRVSVLISARNEVRDIGWKVAETLNWDYPGELEVLVASDASNDGTDNVLAAVADARLRWIRTDRRGGKARALNRLAELATGELLFFTDANAHIQPQCLRKMVRHFADPRVGCVTGDTGAVPWQEGALGAGAGAYWGYETFVKRMENRLGSVLVCDGAIFMMRRSLFTPLIPDLANDLESPLRVAAAGYWTLHEPGAIVLEHETTSGSQEIGRRRRIVAQGALGMWRMWSSLSGMRKFQFVSHKFLRWLGLAPMVMVLAGAPALPVPGAVLLPVVFCLLALTGAITKSAAPWFSIPFYVVLGSWGAILGLVDSVRGRRYDVWDIPTLSRGVGELGGAG
jgi:cellulose synthase/poly-beta-1,6-N-acetylglucosamine synthase-like glycosyltransferase